ncbi:DUF998 domain-containing protein [Croceivirga thetidis]|uniref:DUF998 domain-containing protein n=1 Tax=Croceivirga thetidis TaxID=2721623 RepID=A0ABX1GSY2_9FLAO|nr:DUF998 domain-containing protein [Croceivirga thetidis]NKI33031.1 DUF998 domain-containing protein [Croceivirga thetidis]
MNNKSVSVLGIVGAVLFVVTSIVGGFLIEDYSVISQYISEAYAIDTEHGLALRMFGFVPSGVLLALFSILAINYFPGSKSVKIGFYGIALFYGLATVVVSIFPCDSGCNPDLIDPSVSQLIHNLVGMLTYLFVPITMIVIGQGLRKSSDDKKFSLQSTVLGILALLFVVVLFSEVNSEFVGLIQRVVEATFIIWIFSCAMAVRNTNKSNNKVP